MKRKTVECVLKKAPYPSFLYRHARESLLDELLGWGDSWVTRTWDCGDIRVVMVDEGYKPRASDQNVSVIPDSACFTERMPLVGRTVADLVFDGADLNFWPPRVGPVIGAVIFEALNGGLIAYISLPFQPFYLDPSREACMSWGNGPGKIFSFRL